MPSRKSVFISILLKGLSSVIIQTLLIRELLIVFYGNELTFGIILSIWLLSGAVGASLLGNLFKSSSARPFAFFQFLLGALAPFSLALIRSSKILLNIPFGEALSLGQAILIAMICLAPCALCDGALFNIGFRLFSSLTHKKESPAAKIYLWECLGSIIGGFLFTFILLKYMNSFEIMIMISLLNLLCANFLLLNEKNRLYRAFMAILFLNALAFLCLSGKIQGLTLNKQWKDRDLVRYANSVYGNIAAVKDAGQYTLYYDGLPSVVIPTQEEYFTEDFVHFPLLAKPESKNILFIGNAVGGLIREAQKYAAVSKIVYVELDPLFLRTIRSLKEPATEAELNDPRVKVVLKDARNFIKETKDKFDIIYLNTSLPTSLSLNRYYTEEFYREVYSVLNDSGIAVFKTWGSLAYLSQELKDMNATMIKTLSRVFPQIRMIPGDGFNIFLVSKTRQDYDPYILGARLKYYNIPAYLINTDYIALRLQKPYLEWFLTNMQAEIKNAGINRDLKPQGLYDGLRLYYSQFSKKIPQLIGGFKKIRTKTLVFYLAFLSLFWWWRMRHSKNLGPAYKMTIISTGMYCLAAQIAVIFLFQSLLGYLYQWLAILTMSFMAGASLGAYTANRKISFFNTASKLVRVEIALPALTSFLMIIAVLFFEKAGGSLSRWLLSLVSVSAGFMVGLELPIVFELYKHAKRLHHTEYAKTAGLFYSLDLLGACLGAIIAPLVLIPSSGIIAATQILFLVKAANATILWSLTKE
ncbi:MAG TPA: hypothetical protein PLU24_02620 [Candidatus Omnitrophota bacterium]|nr:hypothetical protein [Candidatus Omnitrophota bacterium]